MRIFRFIPSRSLCTGIIYRNRLHERAEPSGKSDSFQRTTVDTSEIEHHGRLSSKWWDADGELHGLHAMNPLRIQFVRDGLANVGTISDVPYLPLRGVKILDVGCGGGILSEPLARIGAEVTGLDASKDLIAAANDHASLDPNITGRLNYVQSTIENFSSINEEAFDAVIASEVVEHVTNKELFVKSCAKACKVGGSMFLTTVNKTLPSWLAGIIAAEYILNIVPRGTHDWNKFVTPMELQRLLEFCGCKTRLVHGMLYNPISRQWFWTANSSVSYALHAVKREKR